MIRPPPICLHIPAPPELPCKLGDEALAEAVSARFRTGRLTTENIFVACIGASWLSEGLNVRLHLRFFVAELSSIGSKRPSSSSSSSASLSSSSSTLSRSERKAVKANNVTALK